MKSWLEASAEGKGSFLIDSASLLTMIGRALRWVLARAKDILVGAVGVTLAVGAAMMRFMGRTVAGAIGLGTSFVRWVMP